ncbi:MAG: porin [Gammaproteobacteria bacterium]|nr:porin [Gammaproteobacteria bacterium]
MKKSLLAVAVATVLGCPATLAATPEPAAEPTMAEVVQLLKQQQAEIEALKAQLRQTDTKVAETATAVEATASAVETATERSDSYAKVADWAERTQIGGYGEIHYNNKENGRTDEIDVHRFVMYLGHDFNDKVRFFSEIELEHSVAGDDQPGEVELEQAYVEWDYAERQSAKFGLFLVPIGILNETHEPETFYGVERNSVESRIIPSTWWESGVMLGGEIAPGLRYDLGVHSGFETAATGSSALDIRAGRQKSAEATAEEFAYTGRLRYTGIAGLELAVAANYQEDLLQGQVAGADTASGLLYETHAVYETGPFGLRALYAQWDIDGDLAQAIGKDEQKGWYLEPAWRLTEKLGFFARYSEWDTQAGDRIDSEVEQFDVGFNYWLVPNVVLKADWADQRNGSGDGFNLGLGWSF